MKRKCIEQHFEIIIVNFLEALNIFFILEFATREFEKVFKSFQDAGIPQFKIRTVRMKKTILWVKASTEIKTS